MKKGDKIVIVFISILIIISSIGMKMGRISQPGENVICIPYKLIVEIEGKDPRLNDVDAIAGQPADLQR
jgi:type III secretory pathway component EscR